MNEQEYQKILKEGKSRYEIKDGILFKKNKDGSEKLLRVIQRFEMEAVLYMMHDHPLSAHFGIDATYNKIRERYYWPKMYDDIEGYVKSCNQCQRRGKTKGKNELHPIEIKEPFYQIGIDIVGPLPKTRRNNKYIVVAVDYFTKWPEARAIAEASAKEVSNFILEDIICRHGCPKKILSDRGSHFNNQLIQELTKKFQIRHNLSTPYHPKTNGLVERFNKTLCEGLAKLEGEVNWDENIAPVLFAYRMKKQTSIKIELFYLMYGRKVRLPMDEADDITINDRIETLIEEQPKIFNEAKTNSKKSQNKQKEYHDRKIKSYNFEIGEKVLYYKAAKEKQWSGKLEEKWKGSYYIHEKLLNGAYKIKELDGKILKTPVNGELLKRFYSRENYEPYVVI